MSPRPRSLAGALALALSSTACPGPTTPATPAPPATARPAAAVDDVVVATEATGATLQVPGRVVVGGARAVVAAPLTLRLKRLLVLPGDIVARGAGVAEVAIPEVAEAAATLRGARARRAVVQRRREWLQALRQEGLPRVPDELEADADAAALDADIARATALLRVVDVDIGDAALDDLAARGSVTLRAPSPGTVTALGDASAGVVVGAVVAPGTVLCTIAQDGGDAGRVRVILRLPVATRTPPTATALVGAGVALVALPGQGPVDLQDGANDRVYALAPPAAEQKLPMLVDGQGVTVTLPTTAPPDGGPALSRVPASAVRLGGDGVATVALPSEGDAHSTPHAVVVVGRVGGDLLLEGLAPGTRVRRDARAALAAVEGEGHVH